MILKYNVRFNSLATGLVYENYHITEDDIDNLIKARIKEEYGVEIDNYLVNERIIKVD
ncbi:MAG: hypothetical protein WC679_01415 [Bacteroidales bacterium]|jgi:hypothetical protein